jgi:DNA-damage-inducible protein J
MKAATVRARIDEHLKVDVEHILHELGITPSQAITMLYKRISRDHEWPLELKLPNEGTKQVLEETDRGIGFVECESPEDLFNKLGI